MQIRTMVRSGAAVALVLVAAALSLFVPERIAAGASPDSESAAVFDAYAFPDGADPGRVVFAVDLGPRSVRGVASPYFDPNVLYAIDVDNVGDGREHLALQFKANGTGPLQKIALYGPAVPNATGTASTLVPFLGSTTYNAVATLDKDISLFAGPRRDPFFFDREQFERIAAHRAPCFRVAGASRNAYASANVLALVVAVPRSLIAPRKQGRIGLWATASLPRPGSEGVYVQVSRAGRPGIVEFFESPADRAASNVSAPYDDPHPAAGVRAFAAAPPAGGTRAPALADAAAKLFALDELQADVGAPGPAEYLALETATPTPSPAASVRRVPPAPRPFGGRGLASPAMARTLDAIFGDLLPRALLAPEDGRETPCLTSDNSSPAPYPGASSFPYLDAPV